MENKHKTVLIIDDDTAVTKMYTIKFEEKGVTVLIAWEGKTGIALAAKHQPDLILLDILMLGDSGLKVLKQLKRSEVTRHIPVVIFSNVSLDEDVKHAFDKAGAVAYLMKSAYTPQEVVEMCLKRFLGSSGDVS